MEVWFVRSDDQGGNFTSDRRLADPPEGAQDMGPYMATFGTGRMFITWEREIEYLNINGNPGIEKDVYYLNSTDKGSTWGEFLRVDDSDRFEEDRKNQETPAGVYSSTGRVICSYGSSPYPGGYTRDLMVTRHSRTIEGLPDLPSILDAGYHGESWFDTTIGNISTPFQFNMVFQDADNDEPLVGFPRLQIYRDKAGTDPVLSSPAVFSKQRGPMDVYYMDGVPYNATVTSALAAALSEALASPSKLESWFTSIVNRTSVCLPR